MTAKKKKATALQTIRSAEIGVRSPNGRVFLSDPALNRPSVPLDNIAWGILPDDVNIVPARLFTEAKRIGLEVVAGATEGVIPPRINVSDTRARAIFRDGKPPEPNREERIRGWRGVVVDGSLAECIVDCEDAGLDGHESSKRLARIYDDAFMRSDGSATRRVWIEAAQEMIAAHKAREAGLV